MTAILSWPLQQALYDRLSTDTALITALGGLNLHDAPPHASDTDPALRLLFGEEVIEPWNTMTETGAVHDLTLEIWSRARGFGAAKRALSALCVALEGDPPPLAGGTIISLSFQGASLERGDTPGWRRAEATWRAVIEIAP